LTGVLLALARSAIAMSRGPPAAAITAMNCEKSERSGSDNATSTPPGRVLASSASSPTLHPWRTSARSPRQTEAAAVC